jgi:hypothetical protein
MSANERLIYILAPFLLFVGGLLTAGFMTGVFNNLHGGVVLPLIILAWIVAVWVGAFYVADVVRRTSPRLPAAILGLLPLILILSGSAVLLYRFANS